MYDRCLCQRLSPGSLLPALPAWLCHRVKAPGSLTAGRECVGHDLPVLTDCESFVRVQQRNTLSRRDQLVA